MKRLIILMLTAIALTFNAFAEKVTFDFPENVLDVNTATIDSESWTKFIEVNGQTCPVSEIKYTGVQYDENYNTIYTFVIDYDYFGRNQSFKVTMSEPSLGAMLMDVWYGLVSFASCTEPKLVDIKAFLPPIVLENVKLQIQDKDKIYFTGNMLNTGVVNSLYDNRFKLKFHSKFSHFEKDNVFPVYYIEHSYDIPVGKEKSCLFSINAPGAQNWGLCNVTYNGVGIGTFGDFLALSNYPEGRIKLNPQGNVPYYIKDVCICDREWMDLIEINGSFYRFTPSSNVFPEYFIDENTGEETFTVHGNIERRSSTEELSTAILTCTRSGKITVALGDDFGHFYTFTGNGDAKKMWTPVPVVVPVSIRFTEQFPGQSDEYGIFGSLASAVDKGSSAMENPIYVSFNYKITRDINWESDFCPFDISYYRGSYLFEFLELKSKYLDSSDIKHLDSNGNIKVFHDYDLIARPKSASRIAIRANHGDIVYEGLCEIDSVFDPNTSEREAPSIEDKNETETITTVHYNLSDVIKSPFGIKYGKSMKDFVHKIEAQGWECDTLEMSGYTTLFLRGQEATLEGAKVTEISAKFNGVGNVKPFSSVFFQVILPKKDYNEKAFLKYLNTLREKAIKEGITMLDVEKTGDKSYTLTTYYECKNTVHIMAELEDVSIYDKRRNEFVKYGECWNISIHIE